MLRIYLFSFCGFGYKVSCTIFNGHEVICLFAILRVYRRHHIRVNEAKVVNESDFKVVVLFFSSAHLILTLKSQDSDWPMKAQQLINWCKFMNTLYIHNKLIFHHCAGHLLFIEVWLLYPLLYCYATITVCKPAYIFKTHSIYKTSCTKW